MKIIVLLIAFVFAIGFVAKQAAENVKEITIQQEIEQLDAYPNLLPVVKVVAHS